MTPDENLWMETYKGFVNTWECDENDHMNVQFYFRRFAHAVEIFSLMFGADRETGSRPPVRHVRYHREVKYNVSTVVKSAVIADGKHKGLIAHMLFDSNTGMLSATALDSGSVVSDKMPRVGEEQASACLPRGLSTEVEAARDGEHLLKSGLGTISQYHVVQSEDCDGNGHLATQHFIARFTDGAPHIWDHTNLTTQWLQENNYGRVAVEMKLCPLERVRAGTPLRQISWVENMTGKIFQMHHQLEDMETGKPVATGAVVGLVMDLSTRRAISVPDHALAHFERTKAAR